MDANEYEYTGLSYPSVDIEGGYVYVIAVRSASTTEEQSVGLTAEEPPLVGTYTELKWGPEGFETVSTKNLEMAYSVSDIEVVGRDGRIGRVEIFFTFLYHGVNGGK